MYWYICLYFSFYFLSQRGSAKKKYNVWRMNFSL